MEFQLGHVVSIAIMDLIGLCVNTWFLYNVKTRAVHSNAIDILQACKTVLCLLSLIVCVWTEFVECSTQMCTGAKAIADDVCYFSICLTFLAIAYVRYKACEYRGQAAVLLTPRIAIKTLLICFTPVGMFAAATLSLMVNNRSSDGPDDDSGGNKSHFSDAELLTGDSKIAFELCHLAVFIFLPIFISTLLYLRICYTVSQTAKTMEGSVSNRKHDPSKFIMISVAGLLSTMFTVWGIYIIVRIISLFVHLNEMFFLYWKLVVLIVQPSGEGLLLISGKKPQTSKIHRLSQARSTRQIYPIGDSMAFSASIIEDSENTLGAGQLPALIEECESSVKITRKNQNREIPTDKVKDNKKTIRVRRQSCIHPRTSVLIRNAANIGLEYQVKENYVDLHSQRKTSEEKFRTELLNIEKDTLQTHRTRRLSNCLRFSNEDDNSCDEIYHTYRDLYARRGSKFSEKSRKSSSAISTISEFDGSLAEMKGRKYYSSISGNGSPQQKRWRKLYTTARTVKTFSDFRKGGSPSVVEEEPMELINKKPSGVTDSNIRSRNVVTLETVQKIPAVYIEQHQHQQQQQQQQKQHQEQQQHRLSLDNNINKNSASKPRANGGKKKINFVHQQCLDEE